MNSIIIPKKEATKTMRPAGGSDYWQTFWDSFDEPQVYISRIQTVKSSINRLLETELPTDKDIYVEVKLDERASAKSNRPTNLLQQTNLDVVESKDLQTITISGQKRDFRKLKQILDNSNFDKAKTGDGITSTEKNLLRECFAVTELSDKNTSLNNRIDRKISQLIQDEASGEFECIIEAYSNQKLSNYNEIFNHLVNGLGENKVTKRDRRFFIHNMSFGAVLTVTKIKELLGDIDFSYIRIIRAVPELVSERCIPDAQLGDIQVLEPNTDIIFGVIDSGVNHPLLNRVRFNQEKYLDDNNPPEENHGTFVTSRALFGDEIFSQTTNQTRQITPCAKFLDVQVLHLDGNGGTSLKDIDRLKKAILEVVERYTDVKIYNLSIAQRSGVDEGVIDELTEYLDTICRRYDVIFVCSAGNHDYYSSESNYERIFVASNGYTNVASPADGLNVITVGSIVKNVTHDSICTTTDFPSPFTRKGGIRGGWKKPELVAYGGNKTKDPTGSYSDASYNLACVNTVGVEGINTNGLAKDIGTSFSAPLITRECVFLLDYINKSNIGNLLNLASNKSNLIKALLIHSTAKTPQALITEDDIKKAYGFGKADYRLILGEDENEVNIIYADTLTYREKLHHIKFELPQFLVNGPVEFIFTLVYNPPVNKNFPTEYNMIKLNASLKTITPVIDTSTMQIVSTKATYINPPEWNWENYKVENFNTMHFKASKRKLNSPYIEALVQMYVSDKYEEEFRGREVEEILQPYSLVLTVRDTSQQNKLKREVLASNQFEELIENFVELEVS